LQLLAETDQLALDRVRRVKLEVTDAFGAVGCRRVAQVDTKMLRQGKDGSLRVLAESVVQLGERRESLPLLSESLRLAGVVRLTLVAVEQLVERDLDVLTVDPPSVGGVDVLDVLPLVIGGRQVLGCILGNVDRLLACHVRRIGAETKLVAQPFEKG